MSYLKEVITFDVTQSILNRHTHYFEKSDTQFTRQVVCVCCDSHRYSCSVADGLFSLVSTDLSPVPRS